LENIKVKAVAKINIGLNIVSKREDGFHNLETIFYQIHDLYDLLTFEKSNKYSLIVDGNSELEKSNIITEAVELLEKKCNKNINVKITLKKNIPIGAGLGGGSSDGASTLKAINELYQLNLSLSELKILALELGSDVPLFLYNYPTIGKGRGENLTKIELNIEHPILLVNPGIHISTKEAFTSITPKVNKFDYSELQKHPITKWKNMATNDFENGVFKLHPEIAEIKKVLAENGSLFSLMSGTGSTVYGIFDSVENAKLTANVFPKTYFTFIGNQ
jgi:4-diphosphocytidyl-2-C-methyl-D-erythritol kinase